MVAASKSAVDGTPASGKQSAPSKSGNGDARKKIATTSSPGDVGNYQYADPQTSPFYDYAISPCCHWIVSNVVPYDCHPDVLSWLGALCAGVAALLITSHTLPHLFRHVAVGALWIMYCLFDNMDGKQARRTKCSSKGGEFLDHALDSLVVSLATVVWREVLGNSQPLKWQLPLMFIAGQLPIFIGHWGHEVLGRLLLGTRVDSVDMFTVDEFNCLYLPGLCLIKGIFPYIFATPVLVFAKKTSQAGAILYQMGLFGDKVVWEWSLGDILMLLMMMFCALGSLRVIAKLVLMYNGLLHLQLFLPCVMHAVAVCVLSVPAIRSIWAFTLICAEVLAGRLGLHTSNVARLCWPALLEIVLTLYFPLTLSYSFISSYVDWLMFIVMIGVLSGYRIGIPPSSSSSLKGSKSDDNTRQKVQ